MQHVEVENTEEKVIQHDEAEKTAEEEMQHVKVMKTADEEMQLEMMTPDSETSYYEVTQSKSEGDGVNVELITCADIAENVQVGHATKDGEDASEQEAEHHTITLYDSQALYGPLDRFDVKGTRIEKEVKKMMTMGIIEPSKSPFLFFPLLIKNADG